MEFNYNHIYLIYCCIAAPLTSTFSGCLTRRLEAALLLLWAESTERYGVQSGSPFAVTNRYMWRYALKSTFQTDLHEHCPSHTGVASGTRAVALIISRVSLRTDATRPCKVQQADFNKPQFSPEEYSFLFEVAHYWWTHQIAEQHVTCEPLALSIGERLSGCALNHCIWVDQCSRRQCTNRLMHVKHERIIVSRESCHNYPQIIE